MKLPQEKPRIEHKRKARASTLSHNPIGVNGTPMKLMIAAYLFRVAKHKLVLEELIKLGVLL